MSTTQIEQILLYENTNPLSLQYQFINSQENSITEFNQHESSDGNASNKENNTHLNTNYEQNKIHLSSSESEDEEIAWLNTYKAEKQKQQQPTNQNSKLKIKPTDNKIVPTQSRPKSNRIKRRLPLKDQTNVKDNSKTLTKLQSMKNIFFSHLKKREIELERDKMKTKFINSISENSEIEKPKLCAIGQSLSPSDSTSLNFDAQHNFELVFDSQNSSTHTLLKPNFQHTSLSTFKNAQRKNLLTDLKKQVSKNLACTNKQNQKSQDEDKSIFSESLRERLMKNQSVRVKSNEEVDLSDEEHDPDQLPSSESDSLEEKGEKKSEYECSENEEENFEVDKDSNINENVNDSTIDEHEHVDIIMSSDENVVLNNKEETQTKIDDVVTNNESYVPTLITSNIETNKKKDVEDKIDLDIDGAEEDEEAIEPVHVESFLDVAASIDSDEEDVNRKENDKRNVQAQKQNLHDEDEEKMTKEQEEFAKGIISKEEIVEAPNDEQRRNRFHQQIVVEDDADYVHLLKRRFIDGDKSMIKTRSLSASNLFSASSTEIFNRVRFKSNFQQSLTNQLTETIPNFNSENETTDSDMSSTEEPLSQNEKESKLKESQILKQYKRRKILFRTHSAKQKASKLIFNDESSQKALNRIKRTNSIINFQNQSENKTSKTCFSQPTSTEQHNLVQKHSLSTLNFAQFLKKNDFKMSDKKFPLSTDNSKLQNTFNSSNLNNLSSTSRNSVLANLMRQKKELDSDKQSSIKGGESLNDVQTNSNPVTNQLFSQKESNSGNGNNSKGLLNFARFANKTKTPYIFSKTKRFEK